jgi:hypothetical protein
MSNHFIGIFGRQFKHHSVLSVVASNAAASHEYVDTASTVSEAVGSRPLARAPDNPSSTR